MPRKTLSVLPDSAQEFRKFLEDIGESQSSFARLMQKLGDDRTFNAIIRWVQRIALGEARIAGDLRVIMTVLYHNLGPRGGVAAVGKNTAKSSTPSRKAVKPKAKLKGDIKR